MNWVPTPAGATLPPLPNTNTISLQTNKQKNTKTTSTAHIGRTTQTIPFDAMFTTCGSRRTTATNHRKIRTRISPGSNIVFAEHSTKDHSSFETCKLCTQPALTHLFLWPFSVLFVHPFCLHFHRGGLSAAFLSQFFKLIISFERYTNPFKLKKKKNRSVFECVRLPHAHTHTHAHTQVRFPFN